MPKRRGEGEDDNISRDCSWGVVKEGWVGPRKCWSVGSVGVSKQTKPRSGLKNLPSHFHVCTIEDGGDEYFCPTEFLWILGHQ